jgi:23S rRNA (adenine2503-C2)-methyltransferase
MIDEQSVDVKTDVKNLAAADLKAWLADHGEPAFRAAQIHRWIYQHQADEFAQMTNLSLTLRRRLDAEFSIDRLSLMDQAVSSDGTRKFLWALADGHAIESVLLTERNHLTLCISSQVGCAQDCRFCYTGRQGFVRQLTVAEIVSQVRDVIQWQAGAQKLSNIVLMGMGEPLANYRRVVEAIGIMADQTCGLALSTRRITVSTAGLVPQIERLAKDTHVNLAISLNAVDDTLRDQLMPINRRYPLAQLLNACRVYLAHAQRRLTFEYILIRGLNDRPQDARRLATLLRPLRAARINLIAFNPYPGCLYQRPAPEAVTQFQQLLNSRGYTALLRRSKGADILAGCGQLAGLKWPKSSDS